MSVRSYAHAGPFMVAVFTLNVPPADIRIYEELNKPAQLQQHEIQGAVRPNRGRQTQNESSNWKNI